MSKKKRVLKPQHLLLIGVLIAGLFMAIIARIPGESSEPISLPTGWFESIKPEDLVDFGVVPQEKQTFALEAGKVAQLTLEPGQTISVAPKKGTLRVAHFTITGTLQVEGVLDPQKSQTFSLLASNERRIVYLMGEFMGSIEFEVGPINIELNPQQ